MRVQADELTRDWPTFADTKNMRWSLARPENYRYDSAWSRIKDAWAVLTGKADALVWEPRP